MSIKTGLVNGLGDHYTHMGAETFDDAEGKLWTFSGHDFMEAVAGSPPTQNTLRDGEYSTHAFTDQFETLLADHMINFANQVTIIIVCIKLYRVY